MNRNIISAVLDIAVIALIVYTELEHRRKKRKPKLLFTVFFNQSQFQITQMKIQKSKFPVTGHIAPSTDSGAAEKVADVNYSSSNENVVTVESDPDDSTKFKLNFVGAGTAQITATADADLGEGVTTLTDSIDVEAEEDEATKLNMTLDL